MGFERGDGLGDRGAFLSDGHIDALHALAALVQDRVDRDRGLPGLAVPDDELALAAADRGHGVDGLDPGLQWLVHRSAGDDARRLDLEAAVRLGVDRALAVDGLAERVDDPAQHDVAHRDRQDPSGLLDSVALFDLLGLAEHDGADRVLVEVQRQPERPAFELQQLVDGCLRQPRHPRDPVTDLEDTSDPRLLERGAETADVLPQRLGDLIGVDGQLSHYKRSFS